MEPDCINDLEKISKAILTWISHAINTVFATLSRMCPGPFFAVEFRIGVGPQAIGHCVENAFPGDLVGL